MAAALRAALQSCHVCGGHSRAAAEAGGRAASHLSRVDVDVGRGVPFARRQAGASGGHLGADSTGGGGGRRSASADAGGGPGCGA